MGANTHAAGPSTGRAGEAGTGSTEVSASSVGQARPYPGQALRSSPVVKPLPQGLQVLDHCSPCRIQGPACPGSPAPCRWLTPRRYGAGRPPLQPVRAAGRRPAGLRCRLHCPASPAARAGGNGRRRAQNRAGLGLGHRAVGGPSCGAVCWCAARRARMKPVRLHATLARYASPPFALQARGAYVRAETCA